MKQKKLTISAIIIFCIIRMLELVIDIRYGDGNGIISHPIIAPLLNFTYIILLVFVFERIYTLYLYKFNIKDFFKKYSFIFSIIVFCIPFFIKRIAFYYTLPIVGFDTDSLQYYLSVDQINNGFLPNYEYVSPGISLLMKLIFFIKPTNVAFIFTQSILTFCCSIFLIYTLHRYFKHIGFFFTIALTFFTNLTDYIIYETSLLTECLYICSLFLFFGTFLLTIKSRSLLRWIFLSLTVCLVFLIRPAGIMLIPIIIVIVTYQIINKYSPRFYVLFLIPIISYQIILRFYNEAAIGQTVGNMSIYLPKTKSMGVYPYFIESDKIKYHPTINQVADILTYKLDIMAIKNLNDSILIKKVLRHRILPQDQFQLRNSWNLDTLHNIYFRYIPTTRCFADLRNLDSSFSDINLKNEVMAKYILSLKEKYPQASYKFILTNFYYYFFKNKCDYSGKSFYNNILDRIENSCFLQIPENNLLKYSKWDSDIFISFTDDYYLSMKNRRQQIVKDCFKEFFNYQVPGNILTYTDSTQLNLKIKHLETSLVRYPIVFYKAKNKHYLLIPNFSIWLTDKLDKFLQRIFVINNATFLGIVLFLAFILSGLLCLRSKFRDPDIALIFCIIFIAIIQGLVVSMRLPHPRYSFQLEFIKYFSFVFLILLLYRFKVVKGFSEFIGNIIQKWYGKYKCFVS